MPDTHVTVTQIFDLLKRHPKGLTPKQAAAELNWRIGTASGRLSRLATYNVIDRIPDPNRNTRGLAYLYRLKPPEPRAEYRTEQLEWRGR